MFTNIQEIEYKYSYDFNNYVYMYKEHILNIFNGKEYTITEDSNINIIIGLYKLVNNNAIEGKQILENEYINKSSIMAANYLGIYYKCIEFDEDSAIKYMMYCVEKGDIQSSANLAIIYLNKRQMQEFLKYNMIALNVNNDTAIINMGIYYHMLEDYTKSIEFFQKSFDNNSHNAYYIYSKLVKPINDKIKYCMIAIKIKPTKLYIDNLINITNPLQRYILYKKYNIELYSKLDNTLNDLVITIRYNSMCFVCMKYNDLIKFKCNHSMCMECILNSQCRICR